MTKISELCGTGSLGFLDLREGSFSNSEQMLSLPKVATETHANAALAIGGNSRATP